ncbi:hypothetical protein ABC977_17785 [Thioalkalicoccus limnaeus]|uniref:Uncharacterized protein n=1 Tax=Thioalkalicoccus limnaeus TaxID=120681 RepID=A0ABV4BIB0_9GAMM
MTEVYVAVIAATISVGTLIWNLATTRISRALVLSAEETAKRAELVRLHGLEAVDELLSAVSKMIGAVSGLGFLKKYGVELDPTKPETQQQIKTIGEERSNMAKVRITSAPYLDHELIGEIDKILAATAFVEFDKVEEVESQLHDFVNRAAQYARSKYLG